MMMNPKNRYEVYKYYTLSDFSGSTDGDYIRSMSLLNIRGEKLGYPLTDRNPLEKELIDIYNDPITQRLWYAYILPHNYDQYVAIRKNEADLETVDGFRYVFLQFFRLFESTLVSSYKKYKKLITLYEEKENTLLEKVSSSGTSKSRMNEVPQAKVNDPYDEKFANNTSVNEFENFTDGGTVIERLEEVRMKRTNLFKEWSEEFDSLFIDDKEDEE